MSQHPMGDGWPRPQPTSRLESQVRSYWDACQTLRRADAWLPEGAEAAVRSTEAIQVLSGLIAGHTPQRLRLAAGDRLMSLAPEAASVVFESERQIDY